MATQVPIGGGLYVISDDVELNSCAFTGNSADSGGAIWVESQESDFDRCLFDGNKAQAVGGAVCTSTVDMMLIQCTFCGNSATDGNALACVSPSRRGGTKNSVTITNSILWDGGNEIGECGNAVVTVSYSDAQGGFEGEGNIDEDPCFAEPGQWVLPAYEGVMWVSGDYHLKSQAGRWNSATQSWITDDVTSPCIDMGNPADPIGQEPFPNDGIVNMGVYGGTAEASKSFFCQPPCETIIAGDINGDCQVDFLDLAILASHWSWQEASIYNEPPIVVVTEPADGDTLIMSDPNRPLLLRAEASDIDGSVVSVDFLIGWISGNYGLGGTYKGQQDANGWYYQWYWSKASQQPTPGSSITVAAKAMDNGGAVALSPEIVITVVGRR